jgi:hypothetical protein
MTLGSTGGGSARQSPTSRSNQFTDRAAGAAAAFVLETVSGATLVDVAVGAGVVPELQAETATAVISPKAHRRPSLRTL